jgi:hypothetical protein
MLSSEGWGGCAVGTDSLMSARMENLERGGPSGTSGWGGEARREKSSESFSYEEEER